MPDILWLNWSGGGNLPPSLGIARVLTERGHRVSFAGRPEMVPRVERAGFRAVELTRAYEQADRYPPNKWLPRAASFLTSPAVAEQIGQLLAAENPNLVVVDQMFPVALIEAARFGRPSIAVCHTSVWRALDMWRKFFAMLVGLRHVGPVLDRELHGICVQLPWEDDPSIPLVLVTFSTMPEQGSVQKFQNAIDALSTLPVRGVVTVGDSIDAAALQPSGNVTVFATADHDDLMRRASLVVTHGGHGTFMRALKNGLPMVVIPGLGGDQPINAAAAQEWGVGRKLPPDATADMMRDAVRHVLATPACRETALRLSTHLVGVDGAANAADEIEALIANNGAARTATAA
jgi:UDP:flavonoid glycosyltransferase YjiC (YdhE family)